MGPPIPGRIPWREIRDWSYHEGLSDEEMDTLDYLIGEMDQEYLAAEAKRRNK